MNAGTTSPTLNLAQRRLGPRNPVLTTPVGEVLHGVVLTQADHDLEAQIAEAAHQCALNERAGNLQAAELWAEAMQRAIAARRPEIVKAWLTEESRQLDQGLDYFGSGAAHDERRTAR